MELSSIAIGAVVVLLIAFLAMMSHEYEKRGQSIGAMEIGVTVLIAAVFIGFMLYGGN